MTRQIVIIMSLILFMMGIIFGWAKCCIVLLGFAEKYENLSMLLGIVGGMLVAGLLLGSSFIIGHYLDPNEAK